MKGIIFRVGIIILIVSLCFIPVNVSLVYGEESDVVYVKWNNFSPLHVYVQDGHLLVIGIGLYSDEVEKNQPVVVFKDAKITDDGKLQVATYWNPPDNDVYVHYPQLYREDGAYAIVRYGDYYIVSTIPGYYSYKIGDKKINTYGIHGAPLEDMVIYDGKIYATMLGDVGIVGPTTEFQPLSRQLRDELMNDEGVDVDLYVLKVYKKYLVATGYGGVFFFDKNFQLVKRYIDEDGMINIPPYSGQDNAVILGNYLVFGGGEDFDLLTAFHLDTWKSFSESISVSKPSYVATDGDKIYVAGEDGDVAAYKLDGQHQRFILVWQKKLGHPIYGIAAYRGKVYLAMGDKGIGVISSSLLFTDVPTDYWAYDAISYLVAHHVVHGYPDGSFKPEGKLTRAEFAVMLTESMGLKKYCDDTLPEIYKDVHAGDWYCLYITPVVKAGYMRGYGDGRFGPNDKLTKEQILTTIVRIKKWALVSPDSPTFPDVPATHWAYRYIETAVAHNLVKKVDAHITDGPFHLGIPATRAQTSVFMYRMLTSR